MNLRLWLKRSFWLSAWALWACFGWALYVVLPRAVNPPIATLPLSKSEQVIRFLESEPILVTFDKKAASLRIWDARNASPVRTLHAFWNGDEDLPFSRRYGKAMVSAEPYICGSGSRFVLDVRTGESVELQPFPDARRAA